MARQGLHRILEPADEVDRVLDPGLDRLAERVRLRAAPGTVPVDPAVEPENRRVADVTGHDEDPVIERDHVDDVAVLLRVRAVTGVETPSKLEPCMTFRSQNQFYRNSIAFL
jgi:hypothetical protein